MFFSFVKESLLFPFDVIDSNSFVDPILCKETSTASEARPVQMGVEMAVQLVHSPGDGPRGAGATGDATGTR